MLHTRFTVPVFIKSCALVILLMSAGCVSVPTEIEVAAPAPPPTAEPPPTRVPARPEPAPAPPPEPTRTAVLLSDDIPVFSRVAEELERRVEGHLTIHSLDGRPANASRVLAEIADADRLVAVGLLAATVARQATNKPIVFCKVFNYQDYDLISPSSKGVSLLPPFEIQLAAWMELAPGLQNIGVITGPDQEGLLAEMQHATEKLQISLSTRIVTSDKEALVAFKRLTPDIQGLWLVPDNRILSPEVVREIMSYSARHRKHVVVSGSNLLGLGALMSIDSDDGDVADQVLSRLDSVAADGRVAGPEMMPLTKVRIEINREVARHLGLTVSEEVARSRAGE